MSRCSGIQVEKILIDLIMHLYILSFPAPQAYEPYLTLATVYEEIGDKVKLFQILLIAAHLKRTDPDLWRKCASMAKEQENLKLTIKCLSQGELTNKLIST